jgi:glycosyltransferase involved in cell wall biosynthesis
MAMEVTILMPCLDEERTIEACIAKAVSWLSRNGVDGEILVADNASTDRSRELAAHAGARVILVPQRGYGAASRAGIQAAKGKYVIMGDADGSYDFSDLNAFLEKLREGFALVMGNRFLGGIEPGAMPSLHRYFGTPALTLLGRILFPNPCHDFHCGLRGFDRTAILGLHLQSEGMEYATEMIVKAVLNHLSITEIPTILSKDGRNRPPHLRTWRDGWRNLLLLTQCKSQALLRYD